MVKAIVKNNRIPITIAVIRFDKVVNPKSLATNSIEKGKTATKKTINDEKYHSKEYLMGILPFLKTIVTTIDKMMAKEIKLILKDNDIIYTSLFPPLK